MVFNDFLKEKKEIPVERMAMTLRFIVQDFTSENPKRDYPHYHNSVDFFLPCVSVKTVRSYPRVESAQGNER